jgi:hypothetical protein
MVNLSVFWPLPLTTMAPTAKSDSFHPLQLISRVL